MLRLRGNQLVTQDIVSHRESWCMLSLGARLPEPRGAHARTGPQEGGCPHRRPGPVLGWEIMQRCLRPAPSPKARMEGAGCGGSCIPPLDLGEPSAPGLRLDADPLAWVTWNPAPSAWG